MQKLEAELVQFNNLFNTKKGNGQKGQNQRRRSMQANKLDREQARVTNLINQPGPGKQSKNLWNKH